MNILNIVDNLTQVNFGIWNAAISTATELKTKYQIKSFLLYPEIVNSSTLTDVTKIPIHQKLITKFQFKKKNSAISFLTNLFQKYNLTHNNTIVVTHGCWQFPTKWGCILSNMGYNWIYVPHGMLEPWSLSQKKFRKLVYWKIFEHKLAKKANYIRAVGSPEFYNLKTNFHSDKLILIPNGSNVIKTNNNDFIKEDSPIQYLFMARIHFKKGIIPMVKAWKQSNLNNNKKYKLIIAGPDDGTLEELKQEISTETTNINYVGPQYGKQKDELLKKSSFYLLPSFSEGFPTSILEAMQWFMIPIISQGCNFPEVFKENLAIKAEPNENSIAAALTKSTELTSQQIIDLGKKCNKFISNNYSLEKIAELQQHLFKKLL